MASLHLAVYSPITPIYETAPSEVYASPLRKALQELAPHVEDGAVPWPKTPGIGFDLPEDLVKHFARDAQGRRYHGPQE